MTTEIKVAPAPGSVPKPRSYTPEQQATINELKAYSETLILPESDAYYPNERKWLSDPELAARYIRASKWKLEDAKKRIKSTVEWRREVKPDLISAEEVEIENESGKIIINGYDNECRPIVTMRPGRQNTKTSDRQILHLMFCLERATDMMLPGQDSMVILVDYASATLRTNPSISTANKVLKILQEHYPERLGRAIVVNLPVLLNFFYKGIQPFLDPVTREKMRFNPDLHSLIPDDHLEVEFGGKYDYKFDHPSYWKQLLDHCGVKPDGSRVPSEVRKPIIEALTPDSASAVSQSVSGSTTPADTSRSSINRPPSLISDGADSSKPSSATSSASHSPVLKPSLDAKETGKHVQEVYHDSEAHPREISIS